MSSLITSGRAVVDITAVIGYFPGKERLAGQFTLRDGYQEPERAGWRIVVFHYY